jgi:hypothetical protein
MEDEEKGWVWSFFGLLLLIVMFLLGYHIFFRLAEETLKNGGLKDYSRIL